MLKIRFAWLIVLLGSVENYNVVKKGARVLKIAFKIRFASTKENMVGST